MDIKCLRKENPQVRSRRVSLRYYPAGLKKQIDSLPEHAQHIFTKAHASEKEQYKNPVKRQGARVRVLKRSPTRQHGRLLRTNT